MSTKKFALSNSYFKNRRPEDPDTLSEIVAWYREHGELPFRYESGDLRDWPYDTVCERQKRHGVQRCQYLTPDTVANEMALLASAYATTAYALDACCGTGQITKALLRHGFHVDGFDIDPDMLAAYNLVYPQCGGHVEDITLPARDGERKLIVSNPPFDRSIAVEFMVWLTKRLAEGGIAVLLLPVGYVDKERPKALVENLSRLQVLHRSAVTEKFVHTNGNFELVVVEKTE